MTKLFMEVIFLIIILPFVYAFSSCCCINNGGGVSCTKYASDSFCGSPGLSTQLKNLDSIGCYSTNFFTNGCGGYGEGIEGGEGCWACSAAYCPCANYETGSCKGECFYRSTEKCCSDSSGLICGKEKICTDTSIPKDGKSDVCLDEQIPECPSSEELGSCKTCNINTGEISNIPLGISSGECLGLDLNNECNEFMCDGFGNCISNYSENLCTPYISVSLNAKVNGFLVDDFNKLKDKLDEINYSEIFPPKLSCNASVGNYKINGDFIPSKEIVNLKFDFFIESAEGRKNLYSKNLDCQGNCGLDLPEEKAKEINPDDTISCEIKKDSETKQSNSMKMPDFYLFIKNIKTFNVIEDVSLVASKPLGISVFAFFDSSLITNMDKDVPVKIKYSSPGNPVYVSQINFKPMKEFNLDEAKNRVKQNPENPDKKDIYLLEKVKKAEDSVNFFKLPVPNEGTVSVAAEISPESIIKESFGVADNYKTESFSVVKTRKLRILPVNIIFRDIDLYSPRRPLNPIKEYSISSDKANSEHLSKEITARSMDFVEILYPISQQNVEILKPVTVTITRVVDSSRGILPLSDKNYACDSGIINNIFSNLVSQAKIFGADYAVGIVPGKVMATKEGSYKGVADRSSGRAIILTGPDCFDNKTICLDNEKIMLNVGFSTLAHELAHINGISAGVVFPDYYSSELGIGTSKGWVINQSSGEGIVPRMNIWLNPGEKAYTKNMFDMYVSGENKYFKTKISSPTLLLVADLLANLGGEMHVYKEQYEKLLNNYKGDYYKYKPTITASVLLPARLPILVTKPLSSVTNLTNMPIIRLTPPTLITGPISSITSSINIPLPRLSPNISINNLTVVPIARLSPPTLITKPISLMPATNSANMPIARLINPLISVIGLK